MAPTAASLSNHPAEPRDTGRAAPLGEGGTGTGKHSDLNMGIPVPFQTLAELPLRLPWVGPRPSTPAAASERIWLSEHPSGHETTSDPVVTSELT